MTTTYVTKNSYYEIDLAGMRYRRDDRQHTGLPATVMSHRLTYGEWHPLKQPPQVVKEDEDESDPDKPVEYILHLHREDSTFGILTSPLQGTLCPSPTSCPPMTRAMCLHGGIHPVGQ